MPLNRGRRFCFAPFFFYEQIIYGFTFDIEWTAASFHVFIYLDNAFSCPKICKHGILQLFDKVAYPVFEIQNLKEMRSVLNMKIKKSQSNFKVF